MPCTNLFSAEPDAGLVRRLEKTIMDVGGKADPRTGACKGFLCDEAAIISNTVTNAGFRSAT